MAPPVQAAAQGQAAIANKIDPIMAAKLQQMLEVDKPRHQSVPFQFGNVATLSGATGSSYLTASGIAQ